METHIKLEDIVSWEFIPKETVYDIEVEENHNYYVNSTEKEILVHNSGKSYSITQAWILKLLQSKKKLLVLRQTSSTLNDSCIALFKDVLGAWKIPYSLNKTEKTIEFRNGSQILFKGLDNVEKLKSIAGLTAGVWVEEATELDGEDVFAQINARVRGIGCEKAKIIVSFNPVSKSNWVYKEFHKDERDDAVVMHSTFSNNKFLDEEYGKQLQRYKISNPLFYEIYCLGKFGFIASGQEIMSNFSLEKHVKSDISYDPSKPLVLSFDENFVPHVTLLIGQQYGKEMRFIDEICIKMLEPTCLEFCRKYGNHTEAIFITGDSTAKKGDAKLPEGENFYTMVLNELRKTFKPNQLKLNILTNGSVFLRSNWLNELAYSEKIKIRVSDKCVKLIEDLEECIWNADGKGIDKARKSIVDPYSGKKSNQETRGHLFDTFAYLMFFVYQNDFQLYKRGGAGTLASKFNASQHEGRNYRTSNY
jgi:phage terminase large subunit